MGDGEEGNMRLQRGALDATPERLSKGDVAMVTRPYFSGNLAKGIPNRRAFPVFFPRAFDLVRGGRTPPDKTFWKIHIVELVKNHVRTTFFLATGLSEKERYVSF